MRPEQSGGEGDAAVLASAAAWCDRANARACTQLDGRRLAPILPCETEARAKMRLTAMSAERLRLGAKARAAAKILSTPPSLGFHLA